MRIFLLCICLIKVVQNPLLPRMRSPGACFLKDLKARRCYSIAVVISIVLVDGASRLQGIASSHRHADCNTMAVQKKRGNE